MNPQIMSKLQAEIEAHKAAYFARGGKTTYLGCEPPAKEEWVDTVSASLIVGVHRRTLTQMLSDTTKAGVPCAVTKMENGKRMWLRSSVEALRDKRRAA